MPIKIKKINLENKKNIFIIEEKINGSEEFAIIFRVIIDEWFLFLCDIGDC